MATMGITNVNVMALDRKNSLPTEKRCISRSRPSSTHGECQCIHELWHTFLHECEHHV